MRLMQSILSFARDHRVEFVTELQSFIRFPSISTQPRFANQVWKCAAWLANHLRAIGLEQVQVIPTARHPLVYAQWKKAVGRPTVLIYGHYDVQPPEPMEEWRSPPFEPVVRGDDLFGRGASNNKGQMFAHLKAIEAYLKTVGRLPVNVICLFEGEEEIGSPNLGSFLASSRNALAADCAVISDTQIPAPDSPAITYALRGALSVELEVLGPKRELHSGLFGGVVHNPLQALCEMIAQWHDASGHVNIPGFYDRVRPWHPQERAYMKKVGPADKQILQDSGAAAAWGERGYSLYERTTIRPALTVTSIVGGYQGPGVKAAIPNRAVAKLNFRLAPDQEPQEIDRLFRQHIAKITPSDVQTRIRTFMSAKPVLIDRDHPAFGAAIRAYQRGFGNPPVFLRNGGTIPVVNLIREALGMPVVLMGFGLPDDHIHAPNEKFHLPSFYKGIETSIQFMAEVGAWQAMPAYLNHGQERFSRGRAIAA